MRSRHYIFFAVTGLLTLFFWYYTTLFCAVYVVSSPGWIQSAAVALCFDWFVFALVIPISLGITRSIAIRFPYLSIVLKVQKYVCIVVTAFLG